MSNSNTYGPTTTTRQAWREIRDHTEREAESRRAFIDAMKESVLRVLGEMSYTQNRIRQRIKEDLKVASDVSLALQFRDRCNRRVQLS